MISYIVVQATSLTPNPYYLFSPDMSVINVMGVKFNVCDLLKIATLQDCRLCPSIHRKQEKGNFRNGTWARLNGVEWQGWLMKLTLHSGGYNFWI